MDERGSCICRLRPHSECLLRRCSIKRIILWYQVPHLRVALSDSGRCLHRRRTGREGHGQSGLSSRPCNGWLPTRASSEFMNEPPSRVRRGRCTHMLQTYILTAYEPRSGRPRRRGRRQSRLKSELPAAVHHAPTASPQR